jgi:hypothetical protein
MEREYDSEDVRRGRKGVAVAEARRWQCYRVEEVEETRGHER